MTYDVIGFWWGPGPPPWWWPWPMTNPKAEVEEIKIEENEHPQGAKRDASGRYPYPWQP